MTQMTSRRQPRAARPPARADLDRRDRRAHRGPAAGARSWPRPTAASRSSRPTSSAPRARAARRAPTVMRRIAPVMQRLGGIEQNRERLTSLGTMAAGPRARAQQPGRGRAARRGAARRGGRRSCRRRSEVRRSRASSAPTPRSSSTCSRRRSQRAAAATALDTLDAADAEDELLDAPRGARRPRAVAARRAARLRGASTRTGSTASPRHAGKATPAALHWVAASLTIGRVSQGAVRVDRAHGRARQRGQDLRLHGPRRARRGRRARGPRDDAHRARPQAQAHGDQASSATTTGRCRR